ncbi:MAG: hypothetical protein J6A13_03325 [Paludibacteraceae bacterium]|nr:hypothetical protein [Paludibacteraceae bacterium]
MKLNKLFIAVAAVGVLFSSCEQTFTPEPSPEAPANAQVVYFQTPNLTGVEVDPEANVTEYPIVIQRADSTDALTIGLTVNQNDQDVFNVPTSFTFAAGVGTDTLVVGLDAMEAGVTYQLVLALDPAVVNPYANGAENAICQLGITPIKWEAGVGIFHDMLVPAGYSSVPVTAWYVDYKLANMPDGSSKLCVSAPYAKLPAGEDAVADADGIYDAFIYYFYNTGAEDLMFYIDPNGVVKFNYYEIGCDFGYGSVFGALYDGGTGVYTPGVSVTFPDGAMVVGEAGKPYAYANLSLYLTKEAYLEATAVEGIDAEVSDYEGTFALTATDATGAAIEETVNITSAEDEDGQYYTIEGIPTMDPLFGLFNDKSHMMHIPAQNAANITDEETGIEYEVVIYTMDSEGYTSTKDLILAYNEDGTISIDESSEVIGIVAVAFNTANEEEYFFVNKGCLNISLSSIATPEGITPKLQKQHKALDITKMTPRKKIEFTSK